MGCGGWVGWEERGRGWGCVLFFFADEARLFSLPDRSSAEEDSKAGSALQAAPREVAAEQITLAGPASAPGRRSNGAAVPPRTGGRISPRSASDASTSVPQRTLLINLADTGDLQEDAYRLKLALQLLLEYPGTDRVHVEITSKGRPVRLEMPLITTGFCPDLEERMASLIGPGRAQMV